MADLMQQLTTIQGELKGYFDRHGKRIDDLQRRFDAVDSRRTGSNFIEMLKANESVQRLLHDRSGKALINFQGDEVSDLMERKTTITSTAVGASTTGVLRIDRIPGITPEARQELTVRDALTARPTIMQLVDYVRVKTPLTMASPQVEASAKQENAVVFESKSERIKTIATWIPASRQILDDFSELAGFIMTSLPYYVNLEEEVQLLSGDGTGENLNGLITQSTAFNTALLSASAGWNKIDIVGRAIQQIAAAKEFKPTFAVVHTNDWWAMRLTKDAYGRYLLGDPQADVVPSLFTLKVIPTVNIAAGTFLLGSGNPAAAEIRDRQEMQIEISGEHDLYFIKNLVAIRAEKRLALIVKRPNSFLSGSFTSSPQ